ncbi:HNH endonuclease signature motif containing protein [Pseudoalteromonas sp.]|uniref:HNH endonuclease signature motif containing protein n=1 Tax=Pseudoalteromonas sp. TaxID=53249 RepID=UPI00356AC2FF
MKTAKKNFTEQLRQNTAQEGVEHQLTEKECSKCKKVKDRCEFYNSKRTRSGLQSQCKECKRSKLANEKASIPDGLFKCSRCDQIKEVNLDNLHKDRIGKSNKMLMCKVCRTKRSYETSDKLAQKERHKKWRAINKDKIARYKKNYVSNNRDKIASKDKEYRSKSEVKLKRREYEREYYKNNREKMIAISCAYDSRVRKARPAWQEQKYINEYYKNAKSLGFEVDHIVPIKSKLVCGLHCIDNFQMLTRKENASKGNRFWPDMP